MIKRIVILSLFIELLFFVLSVGAIAYCAGKQNWKYFFITLSACVFLYIIILFIKSRPYRNLLKKLESKEFELSYRAREFGIDDIYNMRKNDEMHLRNIETIDIIKNGNHFSLLAESGKSYIDPSIRRHWDDLKLKLDKQNNLRLLLVNPFCHSKKIRNELNQLTYIIDPKFDLHTIDRLNKQYQNVEIRFTDEIYCSVFFSESTMMYDPYHLGKIENRLENYFLAIKLVDSCSSEYGYSYFQILKNHFDNLWIKGLPYDDFLKSYSHELNQTQFKDLVN